MALTAADRARMHEVLLAIDRVVAPTGDGLIGFDEELRYLYWSPAMERISGVIAEEVLGRRATDLLPFRVEGGDELLLREALGGRHSASSDRRYVVPRTGRAGSYDAWYAPLVLDGGRVCGGTGVVRDTTERKRVEQERAETESRFRNMADASPVLLWMAGTDTLCTFFNQTWLDFTGRALSEEWGVGWAEGVHHEDFQRCMDTYLAAFNERRAFAMEYRLRRRDGEYRWILDRGVPRYLPDGTFAGYIGSCVDISERRQLESGLRQSVRARDDFLAIAAHELRTPLTPIQLSTQSLLRLARRPQSPIATALPKLEALERHVARQVRLVEDLLDVSRLTSDAPLALRAESIDLSALVREVARQNEEQATHARSELRVAAEAPVLGQWDPLALEHVVRNLVSNALKYGAGQPVEIRVGDGEPARIEVRDHGIGIAPDDQARIFERFERAVSTREFGGFGLGLWISRKFVESMGGTIRVESRAGDGATFTIELPRRPLAVIAREA